MKRLGQGALLTLALVLAGCGGGEADSNAAATAAAANPATPATEVAEAEPAMPACPFRETGPWQASVTGGELLVNGRVDIMMAGFKPTLTRRDGSPGVFAFDLALVPEAGAAVDDAVRYTEAGVGRSPRAEIWCGGEKIADVDVVLVG